MNPSSCGPNEPHLASRENSSEDLEELPTDIREQRSDALLW